MALINVSTRAVVFNRQGQVLALFRTKTAPAYPEHWDLPGGQLEQGEDIKEAIRREITEETGLTVSDLRISDANSSTYEDGFWLTVVFSCIADSEHVELSFEHGEYKWVSAEEFARLNAIPNQADFVKTAVANFKSIR